MPELPKIDTGRATEYFRKLNNTIKENPYNGYIPVWDGELYLEFHRGTYTSQGYNKKMNLLTTDSALGHTNALTDLRVTLGDDLWVKASWYRVPQANEDAGEAPLARRTLGCRLHVLTGGKVEAVRSIGLDGRLQWMRIGPDLCDMAALDEMVDLLHDPEEPSSYIAGRVVWLH